MKDPLNLIKSLQSPPKIEEEKPKIQYQQYVIEVESEPVTVLIPTREQANFELALVEIETITQTKLKKLMREFRGLIERTD